MTDHLPAGKSDHSEIQGLDAEEFLEVLLDGTDDIEFGKHGDQKRPGFEIEEVVDIIPVAVVRCRWHGRSHTRFIDPHALIELREIRVHQYLIAFGGFIGDRWCAAREGISRSRPFIEKAGKLLLALLRMKLNKL